MRREILLQADIKKRIKAFIQEEAKALAASPMLLTDQFESLVTESFPFGDETLDRLFDTDSAKFSEVLLTEANELYESREAAFTPEIMRTVEREIYLQILDNLWMQHLENMDHMREGIHWISVGQRDPLVEYRRQAQRMFEEMQVTLRHEVIRALFSAEPVVSSQPVETELTRAARHSVENADQIVEAEEFHETDFVPLKTAQTAKAQSHDKIKKARKAERQRKAKAKNRRKK
jgi:preprotein translocase subunit SecA